PAAQARDRPRLVLDPRRLTLNIRAGDKQRQVRITVVNQGKGVLQGKVKVAEGGRWLSLMDAGGADLPLHAQRNQEVTLGIDPNGRGGGQTCSGKLTVVSNGGIAELPVRLNVTALPFPTKPFVGAPTQRKLAEMMRANPRPAVPLLESGEVRRWFAA